MSEYIEQIFMPVKNEVGLNAAAVVSTLGKPDYPVGYTGKFSCQEMITVAADRLGCTKFAGEHLNISRFFHAHQCGGVSSILLEKLNLNVAPAVTTGARTTHT